MEPAIRQRSIMPTPTRLMRPRFVSKSLLTFSLFVIITILQLCLLLIFDDSRSFLEDNVWISMAIFIIGLILIIIFVFVDGVRSTPCLNWLQGLLIVECMMLGISRILLSFTMWELLASVVIVLILIFLFHVIAATVPHDFTLDVIILFVLSYIFFFAAIYFLTVFMFDKANVALYIFIVIIALVICWFIIYHAQTIIGGRYAEMGLNDYLLAALILYVDFLILFMIALHFVCPIVNALDYKEARHKHCLTTN